MQKTIRLSLKDFEPTPSSLRDVSKIDTPTVEIRVNLANLYHHYYLDKHGKRPPHPDPTRFEHLEYFLNQEDFCISGDGLGSSTLSRRNMSSELGQAFCRWFLHDHTNIVYFAHIERVIGRAMHRGFGGLKIVRKRSGLAPDYFCAESVNKIFLAEAKGSHSAIGFDTVEFEAWRDQFKTVLVLNQTGTPLTIKGYIVATRFATESRPKVRSTIYAEDPASIGDRPPSGEEANNMGNDIICLHYADIAWKLNQPILGDALAVGFSVPAEIQFQAMVWEFAAGPYRGKRYIGGYYPPNDGEIHPHQVNGRIVFGPSDPFRLDAKFGTFVGLEEQVFKGLVRVARGESVSSIQIQKFEDLEQFYSAVSLLKDGSALGPLDFFNFVESATF